MTVNEVLNERGNGLGSATTLSDIGPVEVVVLLGGGIPLLGLGTRQAWCLVFIVPADLHVRIACG